MENFRHFSPIIMDGEFPIKDRGEFYVLDNRLCFVRRKVKCL